MNSARLIIFLFTIFVFSCDYSNKEARLVNSKFFKEPEIKLLNKNIKGVRYYYRTAGNRLNPTLLLLHGFPTNRNTFDQLIPMLASHYYVVAPDHSNTRWSSKIDAHKNSFTFSMMTDYLEHFLDEMEIDDYTLYVQNTAFHIGFQLMERKPKKVNALIIQNAELYIEALPEERKALYQNIESDSSNAFMDYVWKLSGENADIHSEKATIEDSSDYNIGDWQEYLQFVKMDRQKLTFKQLLEDYNNLAQQFPKWQKMLKDKQPKSLIIWGEEEDAGTDFKGAKYYLNDLPNAELLLINSGKYSNKMFNVEVASKVLNFLQRNGHQLDEKENIKPYLDAL
ncbi:alpha/beta fold hydrolase [Flammeovirga sp. EKP202]|uniref:alpha/beta fold hydrolase n=1 Tax=Flammeovirga sp. EKP202 TaxID=2770592 RepID=UPI00165F8A2B|nr:alpha/beta hydrolase [Flammeovirga sp. EKP202]MBD0401590.1 alpha/beta hydrolase [Flammeovirga sp. EKP202]